MKITLEYFFSEIRRFREMMGDSPFWQSQELRDRAVGALGLVYLRLEPANKEENDRAFSIFTATLDEYSRRESLVLFRRLSPVVVREASHA